jgi:hypothetical protein
VRIIEELLEWKISGSGLENRDYRSWESVALATRHPLSAKVALTSLTSGDSSDGIVRLRLKVTEFLLDMHSLIWEMKYKEFEFIYFYVSQNLGFWNKKYSKSKAIPVTGREGL